MSKKIEEAAIDAISKYFFTSKRIETGTSKNDKEPSWDGNLYLYNKEVKITKSHKLENLEGRIPTQIKGKIVKEFSNNYASKSYKISHLNNYYKEGGVLLFLVEIKENGDFEIFYKILLPYDLKILLAKKKNNKSSISIKHSSVNSITIPDFEDILLDFLFHKGKQISIVEDSPSLDEAKELIISRKYFPGHKFCVNPGDEVFVYGKKNLDDSIFSIVEKQVIETIKECTKVEIKIGDRVYFNKRIQTIFKESTNVSWDNIIIILENKESIKLKISKGLKLTEYIVALEFFIELYDKKYFYINDMKFDARDLTMDVDIEKLKCDLKTSYEIIELLEILHIDKRDIDLNKFKEHELNELFFLLDAVIHNKKFNDENKEFLKVKQTFFGYNVLLAKQKEGDKVKFIPLNKLAYDFIRITSKVDKEESCLISPYLILKKEDIIDSVNIKVSDFYNNIINYQYSKLYAGQLNLFVLELIHVFDITKDLSILNCALALTEWLINNDLNGIVYKLNKYQILFRKNELTAHHFLEINGYINEYKSNNNYPMIKCCAYILLSLYDDFQVSFNELEEDDKTYFKSFPIYNILPKEYKT